MNPAYPVRLVEARFFVRPVVCRMPFRYGTATLTRVPILCLRAVVEDAQGARAVGQSADCLPPAWFDKRPGRCFRDDIDSLIWSAATAVAATAGLKTVFDHNEAAHAAGEGAPRDETALTRGFGPALVERALIDAVGKLAGTPFDETVRWNLLGLDLGALHPTLGGCEPSSFLASEPLETVAVRHTVGLADPLTADDIAPGDELDDGLPRTLEQVIAERGVRYFKLKLSGDIDADADRLGAIADLLDETIDGPYYLSLDGNEQYHSAAGVLVLLETLAARPELTRLLASIEYLEQPFGRGVALDVDAVGDLGSVCRWKPVIIDESDDGPASVRAALDLGYAGTSHKNCKGVGRGVANACLISFLNTTQKPARPYRITGEDLLNTAAVPLQQDLATGALLGLRHIERNGHHYVRGLGHLSPTEIAACLERHAGLYEPFDGDSAQVRICDGLLDLRSLRRPGYAVAFESDWDWLTPLEDWRYEDLGLDE